MDTGDAVLRALATGKQSSELHAKIVELQGELQDMQEAYDRVTKKETIVSCIIAAFNKVENEIKRFTDDEIVPDIEQNLLNQVLDALKDL